MPSRSVTCILGSNLAIHPRSAPWWSCCWSLESGSTDFHYARSLHFLTVGPYFHPRPCVCNQDIHPHINILQIIVRLTALIFIIFPRYPLLVQILRLTWWLAHKWLTPSLSAVTRMLRLDLQNFMWFPTDLDRDRQYGDIWVIGIWAVQYTHYLLHPAGLTRKGSF